MAKKRGAGPAAVESENVGDDHGPSSSSTKLHRSILRSIHNAYASKKSKKELGEIPMGLHDIASSLEVSLKSPRDRTTILLLGNHSAGKSSFINWYVGQKVLGESAAVETQGFTFVLEGKRRDKVEFFLTQDLLGGVVDGMEDTFPGIGDYVTTEMVVLNKAKTDGKSSVSVGRRAAAFPQLTFIDTPGLANLEYAFDVNRVIYWLAKRADMILVFLDPHGQAQEPRTMFVVRSLFRLHQKKMHFILSRADDIRTQSERSKILVQLSQSLSKHLDFDRHKLWITDEEDTIPTMVDDGDDDGEEDAAKRTDRRAYGITVGGGDGQHALDVLPLYLPTKTSQEFRSRQAQNSEEEDFNQLYKICDNIEQEIKLTVQRHIAKLRNDASVVKSKLHDLLVSESSARRLASRLMFVSWIFLIIAWILPALLVAYLSLLLYSVLGGESHFVFGMYPYVLPVVQSIMYVIRPLAKIIEDCTKDYYLILYIFGAFLILLIGANVIQRFLPKVRDDKDTSKYVQWYKHLSTKILGANGLQQELKSKYLEHSMSIPKYNAGS